MVYTAYLVQFPVLYARILVFIHSAYNSLHLRIPNSESFPLPCPARTLLAN